MSQKNSELSSVQRSVIKTQQKKQNEQKPLLVTKNTEASVTFPKYHLDDPRFLGKYFVDTQDKSRNVQPVPFGVKLTNHIRVRILHLQSKIEVIE